MNKKDFCKKHGITEDQFSGKERADPQRHGNINASLPSYYRGL